MWYICNCKRDFPLSAWVEECCLAARCIMRSSERTKCISEFGGLWYVKLSPLCSLAHVSFSSFFLLSSPPLFFSFFFYQEPHRKFRAMQSAKQTTFFFLNQNPASWLLRLTPLPNMYEYVMVCLEAFCRARKLKPQSEDQRQTGPHDQRDRYGCFSRTTA